MLTPQERGDAGFSLLIILVMDPAIRSVMQVCINNFCMVGLLYADYIFTLGRMNLVKCFVLLQTEYLSGYRGDQSLRAAPVCTYLPVDGSWCVMERELMATKSIEETIRNYGRLSFSI